MKIIEGKVTEEEIEEAFEGTNFGPIQKEFFLAQQLLYRAIGFHTGSTITGIMERLELIEGIRSGIRVTRRGTNFLYERISVDLEESSLTLTLKKRE